MPYSNHEASAAAWYALLWFSKYESYDSVCALNAAVSRYLKRTRRDGPTEKEGKELGYGYVFEWMQRAKGGHRYSVDGAGRGGGGCCERNRATLYMGRHGVCLRIPAHSRTHSEQWKKDIDII